MALLFAGVTVLLVCGQTAGAQQSTVTIRVQVRSAGRPVEGALVRSGVTATQTIADGTAIIGVPAGLVQVAVARLGFFPDSVAPTLAPGADTTLLFDLRSATAVIAAVVVTSTRAERRLEEEPLRVEVLAGEDVAEKSEMRPADLRALFREMSGVRVQTTSAALGAATVRVQGLRGRYTLVLNDGLPLYGAHASGFGLVQQPPLDLRQVEVIKGAASALYGPAALGGVVNLVSRRPPDTSQVLLNQTARAGTDFLGFVARPLSSRLGLTVLGGAHYQRSGDVDRDGWSEIPGFGRVELRQRLYFDVPNGRSLMVTAGGFAERRGGGSLLGRDAGGPMASADSLGTQHGDVGAVGRWHLSERWMIAARAAANLQARQRQFAGALEHERQQTLFGEFTATGLSARQTMLIGGAWQQEGYRNRDASRFDETYTIPAVFVQHGFSPVSWLSSTLNARCDFSSRYGTICTPRGSVLARAGAMFSVRTSLGAGWFAPLALDEETEVIGLSRMSRPAPLEAEHARTASIDVTVTKGPVQVNGTLFTNRIARPVGLRRVVGDTAGRFEQVNSPGATRTSGAELFAIYNREPVVATAFYSVTHSRELSPATGQPREVPLTPCREAGLDLALEEDETGSYVAAEVFYTGVQSLDDNPYRLFSRPYATYGVLAAKRFGHATLFVNFENLTDVRQSRYDPALRPTRGDGGGYALPAWAPVEGRSANMGIRYAF